MGLFDDVMRGNPSDIDDNSQSVTEYDINETDDNDIFTEAAFPESLPYNRCINRVLYLPKGKPTGTGNLCFLYSHNVKESIALMNSKENYLRANRYPWYFYTPKYIGKIHSKPFKINAITERPDIYKHVERTVNGVRGYNRMDLSSSNLKNTYFDLSRYIEIFDNICTKLTIQKRVEQYWQFFRSIYDHSSVERYTNKFVLVDLSKFPLGKELNNNLKNPLFIIYYTLFKYPGLLKGLNIDFYFYAGKKTIRINPSLLNDPKNEYRVIKNEMNRLYRFIVPEVENILDIEKIEQEENVDTVTTTIKNAVLPNRDDNLTLTKVQSQVLEPYGKKNFVGDDTPIEDEPDSHKVRQKEIETEITKKAEKIKETAKKANMDAETTAKFTATQLENEINDDKNLIEKIYRDNQSSKIKQTPASSARDKMLREKQVELKVGSMTVGELQEIKTSDIPIETKDVSRTLTTSNKKMGNIKFDNIDKIYDEKVMKHDIINAVTSLNSKSLPMMLHGDVKIEDTSDELNYKDTYTFQLEDSMRQRHTIKVDIPKFIDNKFMYLGGNEKTISNQLFLYPVVKIDEDEVQIVTNYNKMTFKRRDSKAISSIERFSKLLSTVDEMKEYCNVSNVSASNKNHVTTLEYDQLSKLISHFKCGKCQLFLSQDDAIEYADNHDIKIPSNRLYAGNDKNGNAVFINFYSQRTIDGKNLVDIIMDALPQEISTTYMKIRPPKRLSYASVTVMKQEIAAAYLLCYWEGMTTVLKKAEVDYELVNRLPSELPPEKSYIRFADCYMVYEETVPISLLMNGLKTVDTSSYNIADMDTAVPYMDYFKKKYGKVSIMNALYNFYEWTIDAITLEVLKTINLPTEIVELCLYAISLLADSQFTPYINQSLFRNRRHEVIPAILYETIASAYLDYKNSNGKKKLSVPRDEVIKKLLKVPTVEDNSTLNPVLEMEKSHAVTTKGFRGINLNDSYTIQKRTYDPTGIGILGPSSSPDGNVGVSKTFTLEPGINSVRGYLNPQYDEKNPEKSLKDLTDINLFSIGELSIPLGATVDDPTRLGHAIKQSKHVIPVKDSAPVLMSNGMEEVCRFHLSSHFVVNAEEDGEVVAYDEKEKMMIVKYKSGKCRAIDLNGTIVKNGGGGFYLSNVLITTLKLGDKFKKDDVLAYHKDFFTNDKYNNCRMNMGTLAKVAIMSTYNTYEDATFVTESLSNRAATEMCFIKKIVIGKNSNVDYLVKKGAEVKVGDPLAIFDTSYEDADLNSFLAVLSDDQKKDVLENSRNTVPSKYSGVIEDIKIFSAVDLDEMSPSLKSIVSKYYTSINKKKKLLETYDPESKNSVVKCGVLMNQTSGRIEPNRFGVIRGEHVEDSVLIEVYIKHAEPLEVGSKIANFTGLKNTIGEVIPEGYEPWSEFRPDEEVSSIIASNSILKRMTPSIVLSSLGNKVVIELKRKLQEIYNS